MIARTTVTAATVGACLSLAVLFSGATGAAADVAKNAMTKNDATTTAMAKVDATKEAVAKEATVKDNMTKDGLYKVGKSDDVTSKDVVPNAMK